MQKILGYMRKAITHFNMIKDGDNIAIGLSGGKDSITLLYALHRLQKFLPVKFNIIALTIDPGFDNFDVSNLEKICKELEVPYYVEKSFIKEIVFDIRNEKNPCSLCANLRRGMLNSFAKKYGCNKLALGHNQDDVIHTFFLSLFYEGSIHSFSPVTYLSRADLHVIRPMVYTPEKDIKHFINKSNISVMNKCCPMDGTSKREYSKTLFNNLSKDIPYLRESIFGAISRSSIKGWNIEE